jgi:ABC-type branched-subunit amino acid transport system substrate-binding protein
LLRRLHLSKEFVDEYDHPKDGGAPGSIESSAIFYDAARMLCGALATGGDLMGSFREVKDFQGAVGVINFRSEAGDQYFHSPYVAKVLSDAGEAKVLTLEQNGK